MKKYTQKKSISQKVNKNPVPKQKKPVNNPNLVEILKQTYKQRNGEILVGIGVIVDSINKSNENVVKAIIDSNKEVIKAINDGNEKLITALTGKNSRINNSHKNNNIENNIKEFPKLIIIYRIVRMRI